MAQQQRLLGRVALITRAGGALGRPSLKPTPLKAPNWLWRPGLKFKSYLKERMLPCDRQNLTKTNMLLD